MENQDHVSQPMAARLKAAGWEGETEKCYDFCVGGGKVLLDWPEYCKVNHPDLLPAPSIGELRERLTRRDLERHFAHLYNPPQLLQYWSILEWKLFANWLLTVTASADALAEVWLFTQNKKGE